MPAQSAGNIGKKETRKWLATYNDKTRFEAEWVAMAESLVKRGMTNDYGVYGRKEIRGWTLYLITYQQSEAA